MKNGAMREDSLMGWKMDTTGCLCEAGVDLPEVRQQNQRGPRQWQISDEVLLWESDQRQDQLWNRLLLHLLDAKHKHTLTLPRIHNNNL